MAFAKQKRKKDFIKMNNLNKDKIVAFLKPYFDKRDDVLMAFLFGSWAKGTYCKESDVDVAIYLKPATERLEWEETNAVYDSEDKIWLDIEKILKKEVDLLVLNRAKVSVAWAAIQGVPIIIKHTETFIDFMLDVSRVAEDFTEFVFDTWKMKERYR